MNVSKKPDGTKKSKNRTGRRRTKNRSDAQSDARRWSRMSAADRDLSQTLTRGMSRQEYSAIRDARYTGSKRSDPLKSVTAEQVAPTSVIE